MILKSRLQARCKRKEKWYVVICNLFSLRGKRYAGGYACHDCSQEQKAREEMTGQSRRGGQPRFLFQKNKKTYTKDVAITKVKEGIKNDR